MERTDFLDMITELKLRATRCTYDESFAAALKRQHQLPRLPGDLLIAENSEKLAPSIKYLFTMAMLQLASDADDLALAGTQVIKALSSDLTGVGFVAQQRDIVLIGGTGTQTTHFALAAAASHSDGARGGRRRTLRAGRGTLTCRRRVPHPVLLARGRA